MVPFSYVNLAHDLNSNSENVCSYPIKPQRAAPSRKCVKMDFEFVNPALDDAGVSKRGPVEQAETKTQKPNPAAAGNHAAQCDPCGFVGRYMARCFS